MVLKASVVILYGLFILIGGIIGYIKAQSLASIIMGSSFAFLLVICGIAILKESVLAYFCSIGLTLILFLFFSYRYFESKKFMPPGMLALVSLAVLIFLIVDHIKR